MLRSNINVKSLLATGCQLPPVMSPVYFMLIHCPAYRKRVDENNRDMLQLSCGSVDIIAQNCFEIDIPDPRDIGTPNTTPIIHRTITHHLQITNWFPPTHTNVHYHLQFYARWQIQIHYFTIIGRVIILLIVKIITRK